MNKLILIAAALLSAGSAFASKARVDALQAPASLKDTFDIITKPDQALLYGDAMVLESGTAGNQGARPSTGTYASAHGGFIRKGDNSAWALYFGNKTPSAHTYRTQMGTYLDLENALNAIYATNMGDMSVGAGLFYAKSARKPDTAAVATPKASQDAMGLYFSAESKAGWDAAFSLGLGNNAKYDDGTGENKMTGKTTYKLSGGYKMNSLYYYASMSAAGAKTEDSTAATTGDRSDSGMALGVEDVHTKDGVMFAYGASYNTATYKEDATGGTSLGTGIAKIEKNFLKLYAAVEADANSWLALRGSISQNVLMASTKASTSAGVASNIDNGDSTTVAGGATLKFGKASLDGTLATATSGVFGTNDFLASTAFTYNF